MNLEKETYEALARGYCSKDDELETLDPDLIIEMADQVIIVAKQYAEEICKKQREICADEIAKKGVPIGYPKYCLESPLATED